MQPQHANQPAAVEVQGGSMWSILFWGFFVLAWKYWVTVDGVEHRLHFATPTLIPLRPGFQEIEFSISGWIGGKSYRRRYSFNATPGTILPVTYRLVHSLWAVPFVGFKFTVIKPGDVRPYMNQGGGYAGSPQPTFQPQYQQPAFQQPQHHQPHYQQPPYQHHQDNGYRSEPPAAPQFTSPFTDSGHGHQATTSTATGAKTKYCTQCGTELVASNRFCGGCGKLAS